jgi:hypothetical protein
LIKFSRLIPILAQNRFKVAVETKAARHQVSSVLFHPRLRLTMSMIFSPSSDALSKPAIVSPLAQLRSSLIIAQVGEPKDEPNELNEPNEPFLLSQMVSH